MAEIYLDISKVSYFEIQENSIELLITGKFIFWQKEDNVEVFELIKSKLRGIKND